MIERPTPPSTLKAVHGISHLAFVIFCCIVMMIGIFGYISKV